MLCGTDIIPQNIPKYSPHSNWMGKDLGLFRGILSVSWNTIMNPNNVTFLLISFSLNVCIE